MRNVDTKKFGALNRTWQWNSMPSSANALCIVGGVRHQWAMPFEQLQSDGTDIWRELARSGPTIWAL